MRIGPDGYRLVLLITSRETRRWVLPKGWPRPGTPPHRQAAREALEEAGVTGRVGRTPIGCYRYAKRLRNGRTIVCRVDVFPLAVEQIVDDWRERGQRDLAWFTLRPAARPRAFEPARPARSTSLARKGTSSPEIDSMRPSAVRSPTRGIMPRPPANTLQAPPVAAVEPDWKTRHRAAPSRRPAGTCRARLRPSSRRTPAAPRRCRLAGMGDGLGSDPGGVPRTLQHDVVEADDDHPVGRARCFEQPTT